MSKEEGFADTVAAAIQGKYSGGKMPGMSVSKHVVTIGGSEVGTIPAGLGLMILVNTDNTGACVIATGGGMSKADTLQVSESGVKVVKECSSDYGQMLVVDTGE